MKGTVEAPRCGFSGRVVKALKDLQSPIHGVDILQDEALRQGLKVWSDWPTYPQLFVKGELIGGCDIVEEMKVHWNWLWKYGFEVRPEADRHSVCMVSF